VIKLICYRLSKENRDGTTSNEQGKAESQERISGSDADEERAADDKPETSGWPVGERAKNHEVRQI
jgi:hypothetical protein